MTVLELIKAQCKAQNVPDKYAERIEKVFGIKEERDGNIIAAVKNFKENILPAIEEAEKGSSEDAIKAVEDYEKRHNLKDGKPVKVEKPDTDEQKLPDNLDPAIKALIDSQNKMIKDLTESVTTIVNNQKKSSTLETVKEKLKGKIDEKFIEKYSKRVNLDAEDIEKEIELIVKEFNEDKQAFINEAVASGNYQPTEGGNVGDKSVEDWVKIMDAKEDAAVTGVVDLGIK